MTAFNASLAIELGSLLREAREGAGLTLKGVAEQLQRTASTISRWERGLMLPDAEDTSAMLALYGVTGEDRDEVLRLARQAANPDWVEPGIGKRSSAWSAMEKTARQIITVEPQIIPGLCQTEAYARSLMAELGLTPEEVDQLVPARLRRQEVLTSDNAPLFTAAIGEAALRHPECEPAAMPEQLRKLLTLGELPNVTILVLPLAVRCAPAKFGPATLIFPRRGRIVVKQERWRGTTTLTNARDVRAYQTAVDDVLRKAMNPLDSKRFIEELLMEMESAR